MMASIPNMRSTPLPVQTAKTNPGGEAASGGFAVQLPAPVPGQPAAGTPPTPPATPVELLEGIVPQGVTPEGRDAGTDGDGTTPAKTDSAKDDGEPQPAVMICIVQPAPVLPHPQALPVAVGTDIVPAGTDGAEPARLPCNTAGNGKKTAQGPDLSNPSDTEEADAQMLDSAVKALLQRKPPSAKEVSAKARTGATDPTKADATPAKNPQQAQTPTAPVAAPAAAPLPVADMPQPALSPGTQPAIAVAEKTDTIEGTSTKDLAVERKLDVTRDGAWLDRLARDIARAASDDTPLRFRLHPQTLGSLHVELQPGDRGTAVRLTVETEAARQILTDAQPRLTAEARAQGVRIAETHVDLSGSGRHAPGDQRRQDEARQTPFIRTAPGAGTEAASARSRRARLDRYA